MLDRITKASQTLGSLNSGITAAIGIGTLIATVVGTGLGFMSGLPLPVVVLVGVGVFFVVTAITAEILRRRMPKERQQVGVMTIAQPTAQERPATPGLDLSLPFYQGQTIRIAELAAHNGLIEDRTFEACYIYGPAVLALMNDVAITDCTFEISRMEDALFPIVLPRIVVGPVAIRQCTFRRCTFRLVGFMGPQSMLDDFMSARR